MAGSSIRSESGSTVVDKPISEGYGRESTHRLPVNLDAAGEWRKASGLARQSGRSVRTCSGHLNLPQPAYAAQNKTFLDIESRSCSSLDESIYFDARSMISSNGDYETADEASVCGSEQEGADDVKPPLIGNPVVCRQDSLSDGEEEVFTDAVDSVEKLRRLQQEPSGDDTNSLPVSMDEGDVSLQESIGKQEEEVSSWPSGGVLGYLNDCAQLHINNIRKLPGALYRVMEPVFQDKDDLDDLPFDLPDQEMPAIDETHEEGPDFKTGACNLLKTVVPCGDDDSLDQSFVSFSESIPDIEDLPEDPSEVVEGFGRSSAAVFPTKDDATLSELGISLPDEMPDVEDVTNDIPDFVDGISQAVAAVLPPGDDDDTLSELGISLPDKMPDFEEVTRDDPGFVSGLVRAGGHVVKNLVDVAKPFVKTLDGSSDRSSDRSSDKKLGWLSKINKQFSLADIVSRVLGSYVLGRDIGKNKKPIIDNKRQGLEAVGVLANVLSMSYEEYVREHGRTEQKVVLDVVRLRDIELKGVEAVLKPAEDGGVDIERLNFTLVQPQGMEGSDKAPLYKDVVIRVRDIHARPRLAKTGTTVVEAAVAAVMKAPEDAGRQVFEAGCPDDVCVSIGSLEGTTSGRWIGDSADDTVNFCLKNTSLEVKLHKQYPAVYPEVVVMPSTISGSVQSDGLVSQGRLSMDMDCHRNGKVRIVSEVDLSKIHWLLGKLIGKVTVKFRTPVIDGIVALANIPASIQVENCNWLVSFFVKRIIKRSLKARSTGLAFERTENQVVFRLKPKIFTFIDLLNFLFDPVDFPLSFSGLKPMPEGERGLGYLVVEDLLRDMLPLPVALQKRQHQKLLDELQEMDDQRTANAHRQRQLAWRLMNTVFEEQEEWRFASADHLLRSFPLRGLVTLVNDVRKSHGHQRALQKEQLLRLLVGITHVFPEKAVQLIKETGSGERFPLGGDGAENEEYLVQLIMSRLSKPVPGNRPDDVQQQYIRQNDELRDLLFYWSNSQLSPDGSIRSMLDQDSSPEMAKVFCEYAASKVKGVGLSGGAVVAPALTVPALLAHEMNEGDPVVLKSPVERAGDAVNRHEIRYQAEKQKSQKGGLFQEVLKVGKVLEPNVLEKRVRESEGSQAIFRHYLALARKTGDTRYWEMLGTLCDTAHCSIHQLVAAHGGRREWAGDVRQAYLAQLIEQTTIEHSGEVVTDYILHASQAELKPMVDSYCGDDFKPDIKRAADGDLAAFEFARMKVKMKQVAACPPGDERKALVESMDPWFFRNMVRSWHREREIEGVDELLKRAGQAGTSEERKAILASIPLDRLNDQLVKAKAIGTDFELLGAKQRWLCQEHIEAMEKQLARVYVSMVDFYPEKVVPGVLPKPLEQKFIAQLNEKAVRSVNARQLLTVFRLHQNMLSQVTANGDDLPFEDYLKQMAGVFSGYTSYLPMSWGLGLLMKGLSATYAADFGRDLSDPRCNWADYLANGLSAVKKGALGLWTGGVQELWKDYQNQGVLLNPKGTGQPMPPQDVGDNTGGMTVADKNWQWDLKLEPFRKALALMAAA